jgi:hypothetical protein
VVKILTDLIPAINEALAGRSFASAFSTSRGMDLALNNTSQLRQPKK